jgi:hypothetical protein
MELRRDGGRDAGRESGGGADQGFWHAARDMTISLTDEHEGLCAVRTVDPKKKIRGQQRFAS